MTLNQVRRLTYKAARIEGDAQAVRQGPEGIAKRIVRRKAYSLSGGITRALLRSVGMSR